MFVIAATLITLVSPVLWIILAVYVSRNGKLSHCLVCMCTSHYFRYIMHIIVMEFTALSV